ncbi:MAG: ISL3 family transposase [Planctomycetes bacterium]|nr:ISL3 family transposase [Planctomycetota bacterium]
MQLKTILNRIEKHPSFVYGDPIFEGDALVVSIRPRANSRAVCSGCGQRRGMYDTAREPRRFQFVPLWGISVFFLYTMRRVNCPACGVKVESVPWAEGKSPITTSLAWFLAHWAKRMSWKEVADAFQTSWESVFRAVKIAVTWGLANRDLGSVEAIGVDEVLWHRGHKYLTVVYEIGPGCKRLLWVGEERKEKTIRAFFDWFGARAKKLKYVCSDMWKPYLKVIAEKASGAIHVLDRFHIMANISKAIDEIRAKEAKQLKADGYEPVLKKSRWLLLKRPENLTARQATSMKVLLQYNLRSVKAYLLKEEFQRLWDYDSPAWAGKFLDQWCRMVMRTGLDPMKKVARSLRSHRTLILNWFRDRGVISAGAVEGLNNKLKLTTRRAYGFRTFKAAETALYHAMGGLPEPERTHRFC